MSYTEWMAQVESLLGQELAPEKWVYFFELWWCLKLSPRDAAWYYRLLTTGNVEFMRIVL